MQRGEFLVAIINNPYDWHFAQDENWYRIPVSSVQRFLELRWPPRWLAFYQTKAFGDEAYMIRYYAEVTSIIMATRRELFPHDPEGPKSVRRYYKLNFQPLRRRPRPIPSARWRRITFIPTTWDKFFTASEINDLYDESPLEDRLWSVLKPFQLPIIRQEWVTIGENHYALDFAVYCARANLGIETDGDAWHHNPEHALQDNLRENELKSTGWQILRFNTQQVMEAAEPYCLPMIMNTINSLDGVDDSTFVPRLVSPDAESPRQLGLFDDPPATP